jgi:hypothetical protein
MSAFEEVSIHNLKINQVVTQKRTLPSFVMLSAFLACSLIVKTDRRVVEMS